MLVIWATSKIDKRSDDFMSCCFARIGNFRARRAGRFTAPSLQVGATEALDS